MLDVQYEDTRYNGDKYTSSSYLCCVVERSIRSGDPHDNGIEKQIGAIKEYLGALTEKLVDKRVLSIEEVEKMLPSHGFVNGSLKLV